MASNNHEDEVDIYGDLPDFNLEESIQKLEAENKALSEKIEDLSSRVSELEMENKELTRANRNLKANISALLKTVQLEIQRKDNTILELRQEREDLFFRRKKPLGNQNVPSRGQASAVKPDHPVAENKRNSKDDFITKRTTRKDNSSAEKKIGDAVTSKKTGDEPSRSGKTKTADVNPVANAKPSASVLQAQDPSSDPLEPRTGTRQKSQQENGDRVKTPTVYRLIPISNSPMKGRKRTKLTRSDESTKRGDSATKRESTAESKLQSDSSKEPCNGETEGLPDTQTTAVNVPTKSSSPRKGGRKISEETPSESSRADSASPKKRTRKPPTARLYVKTRSSARLSAKLQNSALDTSNDGKDISVLEALQLEEKSRHDSSSPLPADFSPPVPERLSPPIPDILSPFPDSDQSPSPSQRLRQGSGAIPSVSKTTVSNINSLISGILKSPTSCHVSAFQQYESLSGMSKDSAELPTSSDKARKDSIVRTAPSSQDGNLKDIPRKRVSPEKSIPTRAHVGAVSDKVNSPCQESSTPKEENIRKDKPLQNEKDPRREVKNRDVATSQREEKKHDKEKRKEEVSRKEENESDAGAVSDKVNSPCQESSTRKEENIRKNKPLQNGIDPRREVKKRYDATYQREEKKQDKEKRKEEVSRKEEKSVVDTARGREILLKKESKRTEDTSRQNAVQTKEGAVREEVVSRKGQLLQGNNTTRNEERLRKEGMTRNGEHPKKEDRARKEEEGTLLNEERIGKKLSSHNGEDLSKQETSCGKRSRKEGISRNEEHCCKGETPRNEESAKKEETAFREPSRKEVTTREEDRRSEEFCTCNGESSREERTCEEEQVRNERNVQNGEHSRREGIACNGELKMEECSRKEEQLRKVKLRTDETPKNAVAPSKLFNTNVKPAHSVNIKEKQEKDSEKRCSGGIGDGKLPLENDCLPRKMVQPEMNSRSVEAVRSVPNVSQGNANSDKLQCDFKKRRRTRIELKVMVKTPAGTPNSNNGGEVVSKVIFNSPPGSHANSPCRNYDVNKTHNKGETLVQETRTQTTNVNKVAENSVRDVSQTSPVVSRDRDQSPRSSNFRKVHNDTAHTAKHSNYPNKRSSNDSRRRSRSRSRSRTRYNTRENLPPVHSDYHRHRVLKALRSPHRHRQPRRDFIKGRGFDFHRRSRSLSPRFAMNRQKQRKEEMSRLTKLPSNKKEREMLLFGKSPDRNSPLKRDPPQQPVVVTVNVRRKRKINLEDDEPKTRTPVPPSALSAGLSSSKQLVQTPIDFRERYAEVFSNTGGSSNSESGAFSSESESEDSHKSDDSYRPRKKRKKPPHHKSTLEVKKVCRNDKECS